MFDINAAKMTVQNGYPDVEQSHIVHNEMLGKTDINQLTLLELRELTNNIQYFVSQGFKAHINDLFKILSRSLSLYVSMRMEPEELQKVIESITKLVAYECHKGFIDIDLISDNLEKLTELYKPAHKTGLVLQLLCLVAEKNAFRRSFNGEKNKIAPSKINQLLHLINPADCLDEEKEIIFNALNKLAEFGVSYKIYERLLNRFKPAGKVESLPVANVEPSSLVAETPVIMPIQTSSSRGVPILMPMVRNRPSSIQTQDIEPAVMPVTDSIPPLTPYQRRQAQIREISSLLRNNDIIGLKTFYERYGLKLPSEATPSPDNAQSKKRKHNDLYVASAPTIAQSPHTLFSVPTDAQKLQTLVMCFFAEMNKPSEKTGFIEHVQGCDAANINALLLPFRCKKPETLKNFLNLMKNGHFNVVLQKLPIAELSQCVQRLISPGRVYIAYDPLFNTIENLKHRMKRNEHEKETIIPLIQKLYEIGIEHHGVDRPNSRNQMVSTLRRELNSFNESSETIGILSNHF